MPARKTTVTAAYPRLPFADRKAWRTWLKMNHTRSPGIWLLFHKKATGKQSIGYNDAVEEALCFGWIDSIVRSLGAESYIQLFTPRKPKSPWSKSNKERAERLIAAKLMTPAGMAKIDAAMRNGSWIHLDGVEALEVPADFQEALADNEQAGANFERFSPSRKKQLLYRINLARRPETRRKRIQEAVALAAENRSM